MSDDKRAGENGGEDIPGVTDAQLRQAAEDIVREAVASRLSSIERRFDLLRSSVDRAAEAADKRDRNILFKLVEMETKLVEIDAAAKGTAARVGRLDKEKEFPMDRLAQVENDIAKVKARNSQLDAGRRADAKKVRKLEETVVDTGKRMAVMDAEDVLDRVKDRDSGLFERAKLMEDQLKRETELRIEAEKELRENARAMEKRVHDDKVRRQEAFAKWVGGVVSALALVFAAAYASYYFGHKDGRKHHTASPDPSSASTR